MSRKDLHELSKVYGQMLFENTFDDQGSRHKSGVANKFRDVAGHLIDAPDDGIGKYIKPKDIVAHIQRGIKNNQINLSEILHDPSAEQRFTDLVKMYLVTANESGKVTRQDLMKIDLQKVSPSLGADEIVEAIHTFVWGAKDGKTNWSAAQ